MSIKRWFKDSFTSDYDNIEAMFEKMRRNELIEDRIRTEQVRLGRKAKGSPHACQRCFGTGVVAYGSMREDGGQINIYYIPCPAQCPVRKEVQKCLGENDHEH